MNTSSHCSFPLNGAHSQSLQGLWLPLLAALVFLAPRQATAGSVELRQLGAWADSVGNAWSLSVSNQTCHVAYGIGGFHIVNFSQPASPVKLGSIKTLPDTRCVVDMGNTAFLSGGTPYQRVSEDLMVHSIDKTLPAFLSLKSTGPHYSAPPLVVGCLVVGSDLYLVGGRYPSLLSPWYLAPTPDDRGGFGSLQITSIANPAQLVARGTYSPAHTAIGLGICAGPNGLLYHLHNDGFDIIDASDSPTLRMLGTRQLTGGRNIAARGTTVFIPMGASGVLILDASNPQLISPVAAFATRGEANSLVLTANLAFIAVGTAGVQVFDISNLSNVTEAGWFDTDGDSRSLSVEGNRVYVADSFAGVKVLEFSSASTPPVPPVGGRFLKLADVSVGAGSSVNVPLSLASGGDENAMSGTVVYDQSIFRFNGAALSGGAAGGSLNLNTNSLGRMGFTLSLPAGQQFSAGTQDIATLSFVVFGPLPNAPTSLSWADSPVAREAVSVIAASLPATYLPGSISTPVGFEAAVTGGDRLRLVDYVKIGRFAAGLDVPGNGEFQMADCAPRSTLGDGRISLSDWVQAGRYVAGLDPLTPVGGPAAPVSAALPSLRP